MNDSSSLVRTCRHCGESKPHTHEFFPYANKKTGQLRPECRPCYAALSRAYHNSKPHGHRRARTVEWRQRNPEKTALYSKAYRSRNLEKVATYMYIYRQTNPEVIRALAARRRARKAAVGGKYTREDVARKLEAQQRKCYWCATPLIGRNFHVDHIIPMVKGGPNSPENICCSCVTCNLSKHDKMPHEFAGRLF